jgi:hypothetical protein
MGFGPSNVPLIAWTLYRDAQGELYHQEPIIGFLTQHIYRTYMDAGRKFEGSEVVPAVLSDGVATCVFTAFPNGSKTTVLVGIYPTGHQPTQEDVAMARMYLDAQNAQRVAAA